MVGFPSGETNHFLNQQQRNIEDEVENVSESLERGHE